MHASSTVRPCALDIASRFWTKQLCAAQLPTQRCDSFRVTWLWVERERTKEMSPAIFVHVAPYADLGDWVAACSARCIKKWLLATTCAKLGRFGGWGDKKDKEQPLRCRPQSLNSWGFSSAPNTF